MTVRVLALAITYNGGRYREPLRRAAADAGAHAPYCPGRRAGFAGRGGPYRPVEGTA